MSTYTKQHQEYYFRNRDKFLPGMSWDNYGSKEGQWSIDHVMPMAAFDLTDREGIYE